MAEEDINKEYHVVIQEYPNNLSQSLYHLQQKGILCDTGMVCKDGVVPIHRLILMANKCTSLDRHMTTLMNNQNQVQLVEFSQDSVCDLVQGLYTGQFTLHHCRAGELLALCSFLGINAFLCALVTVMNNNPSLKQNLRLISTLGKEESVLDDSTERSISEEQNIALDMEVSEERVQCPETCNRDENNVPLVKEQSLNLEPNCPLSNVDMIEKAESFVSTTVQTDIRQDIPKHSMFLVSGETGRKNHSFTTSEQEIQVQENVSGDLKISENGKLNKVSKDANEVVGCTTDSSLSLTEGTGTETSDSGKEMDMMEATIGENKSPMVEGTEDDTEPHMLVSEKAGGVFQIRDCTLTSADQTASGSSAEDGTSSTPSVKQEPEINQTRDSKEENESHSNNSSVGDIKSGQHVEGSISLKKRKIKEELSEDQKGKIRKEIDLSDKPFKCDLCSKSFLSKGSLNQHRRDHSGFKQFECRVCFKGFSRKRHLLNHLETHATDKPHKCEICSKGFCEIDNLNQHMKKIHGRIEEASTTDGHLQSSVCEVCGKTFKRKDVLIKHMSKHAGARPYMCHVCSKGFLSNGDLNRHLNTHLTESEKPYKCEICGKGFSVKVGLQTHVDMAHTGYKPFKCDQCGMAFVKNGRLNMHKKTHTGAKPHKCELCGVRFTAKTSLQTHLKLHAGDKPFDCKECGKGFVTNSKLKDHLKRHSGERPCICDVCGKGFINSSNLKDHMRRHLGVRPYQCNLCPKGFYKKSIYKKHALNAHKVIID